MYIVDAKGKIKSIILPIKQWNKLHADYLRFKKILKSLNSIKDFKSIKVN